jgi:SAM-dependent methyltransferase
MKFNLPIWNGVKPKKFKNVTANFKLHKSVHKGIFFQKNNKITNYEDNYTHMTPLKGPGHLQKMRNNKLDFVKRNIKKAGHCLEIGAGDGYNMKALKWKSYTICDPFLKTEKRKNIEIMGNYFEKINFKKKYDTIIMFAVLEHCEKFEIFIDAAKKILKKNGKLFIEIPVIDNQFLNGDFNGLVHEHITYFFSSGISQYIKKKKMSLRNFYFKNDSAHLCISNNSSNSDIFFDTKVYNLNFYYKIFKNKIKRFNIFLKKNTKKKIVFHGANNGINTLLHFAFKNKDISSKRIFITDNDKNKWNKYIGSHNKKISSPKIISSCDLICVTSLSFKDEIISNLDKSKPIISLDDI